jgi:hypothetical protein
MDSETRLRLAVVAVSMGVAAATALATTLGVAPTATVLEAVALNYGSSI